MNEIFSSDFAAYMFILICLAYIAYLMMKNSADNQFQPSGNQQNSNRLFDPFEEANHWFVQKGFDLDSIRFSAYEEAHLVKARDAVALVGNADITGGEHVGFVIEVVEGRGVVDGAVLRPCGVATWHRSAALEAYRSGETLLEVLMAKARNAESRIDSAAEVDKPGQSDPESGELIPGISAPAVSGGSPGPRYYCGDYMAVITQDNQSVGPISYQFIMIVAPKGSMSPVMFVTAESNDMYSEIVGTLSEEQKALLGDSTTSGLVLGVFDKGGHVNLGPHDSIADLEGFSRVALEVMKNRLNLHEEVREA